MVATNIWFWIGFIAFVLSMLALDLGVFNRTPHVVSAKEAGIWTSIWVVSPSSSPADWRFWRATRRR